MYINMAHFLFDGNTMIKQILKHFFLNKQFNKKTLKQFSLSRKDIYIELKSIYQNQYIRKYSFYFFVKFYLNDVLQKKCINCGKQLTQNQINNDAQCCSYKCSSLFFLSIRQQTFKKTCLQRYGCQNPNQNQIIKQKTKITLKNKSKQQLAQIIAKRKKTCLQKYGCEFSSQNKQIIQKIKKTNLEKYGVENPNKTQQVRDKIRRTNLQRYGHACPTSNDEVKWKTKKTNLERYGVENVFQNQQVKEKIKKTNLEKYGVQYVRQNINVNQKVKKTNLERYGVENIFQNQQVKEKIKKTNLEKYGVESILQSKQVRNKIQQTNLEKYGCGCSLLNDQIKQKTKKTNLERYGVENVFQNQQVKEKIKKTNLEKYGSQNISNSEYFKLKKRTKYYENIVNNYKQFVIPMFSLQDYTDRKKQYRWKCVKCGHQWYQNIHTNYINNEQTYIPRCLNCYPYSDGFSNLQKQIVQFIKDITNVQLVENNRQIIKPYELDIYIPQKNIGIQFDGVYWHSDQIKPNDYHLMKTELCKEKGIQLIHIFQDEWLYKQNIVKDRIKNRIFARKCVIKEIKSSICNQFLQINHIQGHDNSKIRLGLFYNNQLISVMTFSKPRFNRNYEYQLVRFASKLGIQVVGGASKLLKYFQRKYQPKNIISYADRRYSNGKLYYALGFQFLNNSEPNYWWIKNNQTYSRYQCQKHKLKQLLGQDKFNPQLSEFQNMYLNGYNKLYDCGNMVFIKQY